MNRLALVVVGGSFGRHGSGSLEKLQCFVIVSRERELERGEGYQKSKYRIAETFKGENYCGSVGSEHFSEKTFMEC